MFTLTFNFILLSQDLFGKIIGKVLLNFTEFPVERPVLGGLLLRKGELMATFTTKLEVKRNSKIAIRANPF
jgi:hypothetical protein